MATKELGERDRCPHCGVIADIEPATRLRYRCAVCGAPRVPLDDPEVERSGRERKALKQAQRLRLRFAAWALAATALGGLGILSMLVTVGVLLAVSPGIVGTAVALIAAGVPLALALYAARQTGKLSQELSGKLQEAWRKVAEDVVNHDGEEVRADHLQHALRLEEEDVERLLTDLSVHDVLRARVTESGDLVFHRSDSPPRFRVAPATPESPEDEAIDSATSPEPTATATQTPNK